MQTTLRLDDALYREAKADAARSGITLTRYLEEALRERLRRGAGVKETAGSSSEEASQIAERNRLMEALLRRTAHFRMGRKATRDEMNER